MSDRKQTPTEIEESVLISSHRRCAMCFGLKRDTNIKRGQIAHLDGDSSNYVFGNLCFLCLDHHEEYDATSFQAKGYKIAEVKHYRDELYQSIGTEWSKPCSFSQSEAKPISAYDGHYIYESQNELAEFDVRTLQTGIVQVQGFALWGTQSMSPHTGSVDFVTRIQNDRAFFADRLGNDWYNLGLSFTNGGLEVEEQSTIGYHGANVSFKGKYNRI
jgi:hypothetical protein